MTGFKIQEPSRFGLDNNPNILDVTDTEVPPFEVTKIPDGIQAATKYFVIKIHVTGSDGKSSQLELDSRAAFEIAMLHLVKNEPHVVLIKKTRQEQASFRAVDTIIKVPGGYFHDGSSGNMDFAVNRILKETGYLIDPTSVHFFGVVVGHTEIRTPIALGYATRFEVRRDPAKGVEVMVLPLSDALQMAENAVRQIQPFLENDTAFEGLMVIDRMLRRGEILL